MWRELDELPSTPAFAGGRSRASRRSLRAIASRGGLGAIGALVLLAGFGAAPALAESGVTLLVGTHPIHVSGSQITAGADVQGSSYTLKAPGVRSQQIQLTGLSINGLLTLAGLDPSTVESVAVEHPDGTQTDLSQRDIAAPPYPEGPALVFEKGSSTGFLRPITGPGDNNSTDATASSAGVPLEIMVQASGQLKVTASATPKRAPVGQSVVFSAELSGLPPGFNATYDWSFGDGSTATGAVVTHSYLAIGQYAAAVDATIPGSGAVSAALEVVVGHPKKAKVAGAGTSTSGTGGSGTGKGVGGTGSGSSAKPASVHAPAKPPAKVSSAPGVAKPLALAAPDRVPNGELEGILLTDAGAPLAPLVAATTPAGSAASTASQTASTGAAGIGVAGGSIALTIAIVTLGALDERRRIALRTA